MKKWQELSKRVKVGFVGGAAVILIGGTAGAVKVNADNQYRDQKNEITKKMAVASEKGALAENVHQLVDKEGFLKKDLTYEEITKSRAELSELSDEVKEFVSLRNEKISLSDIDTLNQDLSDVEKKLVIEEQLKAEITSYDGWLNTTTDVKKLVLSDKASAKLLEEAQKSFSDANLPQDSWSKKIDEILKTAKSQLSDVAAAEKIVDSLYKDKKVIKDVKRADYEKAVKAVKGLTRKSDKDQLNKKLDAVKKVIEDREKAEKAKEEAEAKKKAEAEAAEKAKADAAAKEKAEATKDVASENDTETANQPASDQDTDSDWSDSNADSDWNGSSNTGNNNWDSGSSSNQGALTGGNQSSGYTSDGSSNSGGSNQSSGGSSSDSNGSSSNRGDTTGGNQSSGNASNGSSNTGSSNQSSSGSSSSNNGSNGSNSGSIDDGNTSSSSSVGNSGSDDSWTDEELEALGWIKSEYALNSPEFWEWLDSMGYSGYISYGDGWIEPY